MSKKAAKRLVIDTSVARSSGRREDMLLIEAAFHTDRIVVSLDETVRNLFHRATEKISALTKIAWVNPGIFEETPIEWLQNGAEIERERLLGYRREDSAH